METTVNLMDYLRVIMYPLCSLGFIISAIYEYQNRKSRLRLLLMIFTAITMLVFMLLSLAYLYAPEMLIPVRQWLVTSIITILTIVVWVYALASVHGGCKRYNKQWRDGECLDGEVL